MLLGHTKEGAEINEMRQHREELQEKRVEADRIAEEQKKLTQEVSASTVNPSADTNSQMLSQDELLSMPPKELQGYILNIQKEHDAQREAQIREMKGNSRAADRRLEDIERKQYEAQIRSYKKNLNRRETIEKLLNEQRNLP